PNRLEDRRCIGCGRELQDRGEGGAGVLDVDVELAGAERGVADEGPAQVEATLDAQTRALDGLGEQLAHQALLGEVLGADDDTVSTTAQPPERHQRREPNRTDHGPGRMCRSSTLSPASARSARAAAGTAPSRMVRLSSIATPRKMNVPRPPAPMAAAIVAT